MVGARVGLFLLILMATQAHAAHTASIPIIDNTAFQLNQNEWRLGLVNLDYGITDGFEVGTVHLLLPLKVYNIATKFRLYRSGRHQYALKLGYFQVSARSFDESNSDLIVYCIPTQLTWSHRKDSQTWSVNLVVTRTGLRGEAPESADLNLSGGVLATSGLLRPVFEYRTSKTGAWVFEANISLFQRIDGQGTSTVVVDERTTLRVFGSGEAEFTDRFMSNLSASFHWSWSTFNLRMGLGYGYLSLPLVNFFVPTVKSAFPVFDFYWRF